MKYGLLASAFSPFPHPGHVYVMKQAREAGCDGIVAFLHGDPSVARPFKIQPALSVKERTILLRPLVTLIVPYKTESDLVKLYVRASDWLDCVLITGEEYRGTTFTGHDLGLPVVFTKRINGISGTDYARRITTSYIERHGVPT